jgi:predicted Rossmann-fold nucleotide-binding protein
LVAFGSKRRKDKQKYEIAARAARLCVLDTIDIVSHAGYTYAS